MTRDDLAAAIRGCNGAIELLKSGKAPGSLIQDVMSTAMTHGLRSSIKAKQAPLKLIKQKTALLKQKTALLKLAALLKQAASVKQKALS